MKINIFALFLLISLRSFGTAQIPDILIYKGDTLSLFDCPLYSSPIKDSLTPRYMFGGTGCFYTACWRGNVATWTIENNKLYLVSIRNACYPTDMKYVSASYRGKSGNVGTEYADLEKLFPHKVINGKVLADWVDEVMYAPKGKELYYIHMGFETIFEKEIELTVKGGVLTQTRELDNSKTRKSKYGPETDMMVNYVKSHIDYSRLPKLDKPITVYVQILHANDQGKIDSVKVLRGYNEIFDNEAVRVIKSIPEWDVLYQHGKRIANLWTFPVRFEWKQ